MVDELIKGKLDLLEVLFEFLPADQRVESKEKIEYQKYDILMEKFKDNPFDPTKKLKYLEELRFDFLMYHLGLILSGQTFNEGEEISITIFKEYLRLLKLPFGDNELMKSQPSSFNDFKCYNLQTQTLMIHFIKSLNDGKSLDFQKLLNSAKGLKFREIMSLEFGYTNEQKNLLKIEEEDLQYFGYLTYMDRILEIMLERDMLCESIFWVNYCNKSYDIKCNQKFILSKLIKLKLSNQLQFIVDFLVLFVSMSSKAEINQNLLIFLEVIYEILGKYNSLEMIRIEGDLQELICYLCLATDMGEQYIGDDRVEFDKVLMLYNFIFKSSTQPPTKIATYLNKGILKPLNQMLMGCQYEVISNKGNYSKNYEENIWLQLLRLKIDQFIGYREIILSTQVRKEIFQFLINCSFLLYAMDGLSNSQISLKIIDFLQIKYDENLGDDRDIYYLSLLEQILAFDQHYLPMLTENKSFSFQLKQLNDNESDPDIFKISSLLMMKLNNLKYDKSFCEKVRFNITNISPWESDQELKIYDFFNVELSKERKMNITDLDCRGYDITRLSFFEEINKVTQLTKFIDINQSKLLYHGNVILLNYDYKPNDLKQKTILLRGRDDNRQIIKSLKKYWSI